MPVYLRVGTKFVNTEHVWYAEMTVDDSGRKVLRVWYINGNRLELYGADAATMMDYFAAHQFTPQRVE